tara:strand:- start:106 stop:276 length:171 start_codon:yes stop_codon:yes gene_type:complete
MRISINGWGYFACAKKMPIYFGRKNYPANLKKKSKAKALEKLDSKVKSQQLNLHFF